MCLSHLIYTVRPCLIHTCHVMPMPRPCPALTMPFFSRPRHSTAAERRSVGYLPAFGVFRLPRGVPRRLSEAYQSSSQRSIPTTVKSGSSTLQKRRSVKLLDWQFGYFRLPRGVPRRLLSEAYQSSSQRSIPTTVKSGSSTLQKKNDLLNCWTSSSDISGYHADFYGGHGTVGAWQVHGILCVNRP